VIATSQILGECWPLVWELSLKHHRGSARTGRLHRDLQGPAQGDASGLPITAAHGLGRGLPPASPGSPLIASSLPRPKLDRWCLLSADPQLSPSLSDPW